MFIHYYTDLGYKYPYTRSTKYPYICAFRNPVTLAKEIDQWLEKTYDKDDYIGEVKWGEVRFAKESHAQWFILRWE